MGRKEGGGGESMLAGWLEGRQVHKASIISLRLLLLRNVSG